MLVRLLRNNRYRKGKTTKGLDNNFLAIPTSREKQTHKCFFRSDADVAARPSLGKAQMDSCLEKKTTAREFGEEKQSSIFCGCHLLTEECAGRGTPGLPQASAFPSMPTAARAALRHRGLCPALWGQGECEGQGLALLGPGHQLCPNTLVLPGLQEGCRVRGLAWARTAVSPSLLLLKDLFFELASPWKRTVSISPDS